MVSVITVHGVQVTGGSKLDPRVVECRFLGYAGGHRNYKVQDIASCHVFISRDVVFEEGEPHRTSPSVGENDIPLFDVELGRGTLGTLDEPETTDKPADQSTDQQDIVHVPEGHAGSDDRHADIPTEPIRQMEPIQQTVRCSSRISQPFIGNLQSKEYQQREEIGRNKGEEWTTN